VYRSSTEVRAERTSPIDVRSILTNDLGRLAGGVSAGGAAMSRTCV
jgi:hypothetical protein